MPTLLPRQFLSIFGFTCCFLLAGSAAHAQTATPAPMPNAIKPQKTDPNTLDGAKIYTYVDQMPVYLNGGQEGLQNFVSIHVHAAPPASSKTAYITFVVDREGNVRNPTFAPPGRPVDASAQAALESAFSTIDKFRPGKQNGERVNVQLTMPVNKPAK